MTDAIVLERARGCAAGAAGGDALGMPLEFGPRLPADCPVREMQAGRLSAGSFTDDTEMALALAESLLAHCPLDPTDLAGHFAAWLKAGPPDVGRHTRLVLRRVLRGEHWTQAAEAIQQENPWSAGNGSVMRCWPVALAHWDDLGQLAKPRTSLADSRLQSRVTHAHEACVAGCAFVNAAIYHLAKPRTLLHGARPAEAVAAALADVDGPPSTAQAPLRMPEALREAIEAAPGRPRDSLANSGWVRHTIECAVWGLLTTDSFEEAVVQVVNLGDDADSAGAVVGALAGAAYGLAAIPARWRAAVHGEWPLRSGARWDAAKLIELADRLVGLNVNDSKR